MKEVDAANAINGGGGGSELRKTRGVKGPSIMKTKSIVNWAMKTIACKTFQITVINLLLMSQREFISTYKV